MTNKNGSPARVAASEAVKWLVALLVSAILLLACAWLYAYDTDDSATVAIIGGADGSTSIVISSAEGDTYIGSAQGMFCEIVAEVTVNDGQIVNVKLTGADETPTLGGKVLEEMPAKILEAQSADVDGMTGATVTTNAVKQAVTQALEQAGLVIISEPETEAGTEPETEAPTEASTEPETEAPTEAPTEEPTEAETEAPTEAPTEEPTEAETEAPTEEATEAESQVYTGKAQGIGEITAEVTIQDGKIVDVKLTGSEETPSLGGKVLEEMPAKIIEAQSTDVDGMTGATVTTDAVKAAVNEALEQAGLLDDEASEAKTYTGTAQGIGEIIAEVTIQDGKIVDVKLTGSEETPSLGGKVLEEMPAKIIEAQSTDVDGMTGATVTTDAVKAAVNEALEQAGLSAD